MKLKPSSKVRVSLHYFSVLFLAFLISVPIHLQAQNQQTINGVILDKQTGLPLPEVSVIIKSTGKGTKTGANGEYSIVAKSGEVIEFSYAGYDAYQVKVGTQTTINYSLDVTNSKLDELVVIGYGTAKRKDLTGAVSSVSGKEIATAPVADVAQAMQGKLAGVNVVTQDGRPGAEVSIFIRGGGSVSQSNQPLILIDGVPGNISDIPVDQVSSIDVLKDASASAIYGARGANGVVLVTTKAAKAGKPTITFNSYVKFNTPTKYLDALKPYDYLKYVWANAAANGAAFQTPFEKLYGLGANAGANTGGIESYANMASDDIQRNVYNNSTSWNGGITLTGGTDKTKILFTANYLNDEGMKINSYYNRANIGFKVVQKISDNLSFALDTRYTNTETMDDESTTNGYGSLLSAAYQFRPIATDNILGDLSALTQGNIEQYGKNVMWDEYNPANRIADYFPLRQNENLRGIATIDWKIIKGLSYHTDFSMAGSSGQQQLWSGAVYNNYVDDATGKNLFAGNATYSKSSGWALRWTNTLTYDFDINADNKLNILAGQEFSNTSGNSLTVAATHFPSNFDRETAFAQINQYNQTVGASTFSSNVSTPNRLQSYFSRINYALKDKYLFTFTFRADGSSKFSPDNQWGYFPAGAFAWKVTNESFMDDIKWLNNLKVRASYGSVGNDGISANLWSQAWASETDLRFQYAINGVRQTTYDLASSTLANPNLKWETTITRDIGTDFSLFNNRLSGTIDYYHNTTQDLLMLTTIPGITGFTSTYANVGQTSNKGFEFSLNGTIFENNDWRVTAGGNINFNNSNVDELAPNVTGLYGSSWGGIAAYPTNDYILQEGYAVGLVRGFNYEGVYTPADFDYDNGKYTLKKGIADLGTWMATVHGLGSNDRPSTQKAYPGLPKYKDLNDDGIIDDKDIAVIGDMNPKNTGGFNLSASYKGIDFGAYFNWSVGNQIYNANKLSTMYGPKEQGVYQNKLEFMNDAYKIYDVVNGQLVRLRTPDELNAANANASLPLAYNEVMGVSTLGIEDGSYLRLNTLVLGYTLPKSIISKAKMTNARIYGSIYNVFTISGYSGLDPEVNTNTSYNNAIYPTTGLDYGTYPRARSFVIGLNVTF